MNTQQPFALSNSAVQRLLLDMAQQRTTATLFDLVVNRLAQFPSVSLARIWGVKPGDICHKCPMQGECQDKTSCLHLLASAGQSSTSAPSNWSRTDGKHSRFPIGVRKVGHIAATGKPVLVKQIDDDSRWIADTAWTSREKIQGFAGQPLVFQGKILGVLAFFTKIPLTDSILDDLRFIADHAASVLSNALVFEEIKKLKGQLESENNSLRQELQEITDPGSFIGQSTPMLQMLEQIDAVAGTGATVLIQGESGTGKELVAQEIHKRSLRHNKKMVKVNCASIPRDLFESEFFGHSKGAFSGAVSERNGRFATADGATLFLDEVGEIPLEHQGKLLRILQEGEYEKVGEDQTRCTDVRIIAATNRDLATEVQAGRFREDLYFRLNVFPITVAPLRERREDIKSLAAYFLKQFLLKMNRPLQQLSHAQIEQLQDYAWPGNIRELKNIIERAAIFANSSPLQIQIPKTANAVEEQGRARASEHKTTAPTSDEIFTEKEMVILQGENIKRALHRCSGKIYGDNGAAALLGIKPTTLSTRISKLGLR